MFCIDVFKPNPVWAALPTGNRIKDPYEILRNALPIEQKDLRELQHKLEETSENLRGNRWSAVSKAASRSKFLLNNRKQKILARIPDSQKNEARLIISSLNETIDNLIEASNSQSKNTFLDLRRESLEQIESIEMLLIPNQFPYDIPNEFDDLPRLLGRANVIIETSKGNLSAIIDGYNAPLTSGAFIDLALKGFYEKLPIVRAEEFFVLQTGDPSGPDIGYINPETKEERKVPLEIRIPNQKEPIYNETFEEKGLYTETPILPFATLGTLGWAHSDNSVDDGSSQFFFFLYEAELNPAGRNLIDGRYSAFGYVIEGEDILNELDVNDQIISVKVISGQDKLQPHA